MSPAPQQAANTLAQEEWSLHDRRQACAFSHGRDSGKFEKSHFDTVGLCLHICLINIIEVECTFERLYPFLVFRSVI